MVDFASHSFSVTYCSFLQHVRNVKIILRSKALPKQAAGWSWPWFALVYHSCPAVAMEVEWHGRTLGSGSGPEQRTLESQFLLLE